MRRDKAVLDELSAAYKDIDDVVEQARDLVGWSMSFGRWPVARETVRIGQFFGRSFTGPRREVEADDWKGTSAIL